MPLDIWRHSELPALDLDGFLVGINWSGPRLVGWDFTPTEVLNRLAAAERDMTASAEGQWRPPTDGAEQAETPEDQTEDHPRQIHDKRR